MSQAQHLHRTIPIIPAERLIPEGNYCYTPTALPSAATGGKYEVKSCPFWSIDAEAEAKFGRQDSGYCAYLREGDWQHDGMGLLWDQIKACGVKDEDWREDGWEKLHAAANR